MDAKFPEAVSSSLLSSFKLCERKFYYSHILRRTSRDPSTHLIAGSAYAKGQHEFRKAYYETGMGVDDALAYALPFLIKEYGNHVPEPRPTSVAAKTLERVATTLVSYYENWSPKTDVISPHFFLTDDGLKVAAETTFAIPFSEDLLHPVTGNPILYAGSLDSFIHLGLAGHYDNLARTSNNNLPLYIYDDKTTYSMGAGWADQWHLRSQFIGYMWGARQMGFKVKGYMVRGAAIQKNDIKFLPAIGYWNERLEYNWYELTYHKIKAMLTAWEEERFYPDFDSACGSYGGCEFKSACEMKDPSHHVMSSDFIDNKWEPIKVERYTNKG